MISGSFSVVVSVFLCSAFACLQGTGTGTGTSIVDAFIIPVPVSTTRTNNAVSCKADADSIHAFKTFKRRRSDPGTQCTQLQVFSNLFGEKDQDSGIGGIGGIGGGEDVDVSDVDTYLPWIRQFLATDYGVLDPSWLSSRDFVYIGPNVGGALNKDEYLAAANFFNLRASLPDLEYRPHDVRLVQVQGNGQGIVRFTTRTVGTFRGAPLRLRNNISLPPNGKRMACPPEAITITFQFTSGGTKPVVTRLITGYTMDRQVGNTQGLCGVQAVATIAGMPPPAWTLLPPQSILQNLLRRSALPLPGEPTSYLAPFPESVMIQLCKGVLNANLGLADKDGLISDDNFKFLTPTVGPLNLQEFEQYRQDEQQLLQQRNIPPPTFNYFNYRVDPYDPYRVWVDAQLIGGEGPSEAWSFTFDDNGYCSRITIGAIMEPSANTGGLGGTAGYLYASGQALNPWSTRPLSQILNRASKAISSVITKVDVDDFTTPIRSTPDMALVEIDNSDDAIVPPPDVPPQRPSQSSSSLNILQAFQQQNKGDTGAPSPPKPKTEQKTSTPTLNIMEAFQQPNKSPPKKDISKLNKKSSPTLNIMEAFQQPNKSRPEKDISKLNKKSSPTLNIMEAFQQKKTPEKTRSSPTLKASSPTLNILQAFQNLNEKDTTTQNVSEKKATMKAKAEEAAAKKEATMRAKAEEAAAKKEAIEAAKKAKAQEAAAKKEAMMRAKAEEATAKKEAIEAAKKAKAEEAAAKKEAIEAAKKAKAQEAAAKKEAMMRAKAEEVAAKKEAIEAAKKAKAEEGAAKKKKQVNVGRTLDKASGTISIAAFFASERVADKPKATPKKKAATVPKGVPVLSGWRKNRNGSVTGKISGSDNFNDGETVTTSPIGDKYTIEGESVVQTKSGSKYYLK